MGNVIIAQPDIEPVDLVKVKQHVRQRGAQDDTYLTDLIPVARRAIEKELGRPLITTGYRWTLDAFPGASGCFGPRWPQSIPYSSDDVVRFPVGGVQEVTAVTYLDTDGASQTLSTDVYAVDTSEQPARLFTKYQQIYPSTLSQIGAVQIEYTAGYGDDAADVPREVVHGLLLLLGHLYENREETIVGVPIVKIPDGICRLIGDERVWAVRRG